MSCEVCLLAEVVKFLAINFKKNCELIDPSTFPLFYFSMHNVLVDIVLSDHLGPTALGLSCTKSTRIIACML